MPNPWMLKIRNSVAYTGVNTKGGLIALRFCLGLIEAGYFVGSMLCSQADKLLTACTAWGSSLHE
jgi:hypothetical protein